MNAPIALFAYNRPSHLQRTLASLRRNTRAAESILYLFSDGSRTRDDKEKVTAVRSILRSVTGFAHIERVEHEHNRGLATSIITGVSMVLSRHGKVIVLEDDLEVAPRFLDYINEALSFYQENQRIFSISGYTPPLRFPPDYSSDIFFLPRCSSWGWATWRNRWERVDWEVRDRDLIADRAIRDGFDRAGSDLSDMLERWLAGAVDSWAIRFNWAHFRHNALSVFPVVSQVRSFGCDGSGRHVGSTHRYDVSLDRGERLLTFEMDIRVDERILAEVQRFFGQSIRRRLKQWFRRVTNR